MTAINLYDAEFSEIISAIKQVWPPNIALPVQVTLVRDAVGHLSVVFSEHASLDDKWDSLNQRLAPFFKCEHDGQRMIWRESELLVPTDILESEDRVELAELSTTINIRVFLVDRLLNNQDWLRQPLPPITGPKLAVAYSIKGGVGRTTAFGVLAWWLARRGLSVALLDLDLESPGAGSALLSAAAMPKYGIVDWLHARLTGSALPALDDCSCPAAIARDEIGKVQVFPAYGSQSRQYISKLGRLYMPKLMADRKREGFAERVHALIGQIAHELKPDVILVDSRAGLDDIGAAAVTRLGAEVFLFSRDETQSWDGYRQLFAHLSHSRAIQYGMKDDDLRWNLKMVLAQADSSEDQRNSAIRTSFQVWSAIYDEVKPSDELDAESTSETSTWSELDITAPHHPLFIPYNADIRSWSLDDEKDRPDWEMVDRSLGAFCEAVAERLDI